MFHRETLSDGQQNWEGDSTRLLVGIALSYQKKGVPWKDTGITELEEALRPGLENRLRKLPCRLGAGPWVGTPPAAWAGRFCWESHLHTLPLPLGHLFKDRSQERRSNTTQRGTREQRRSSFSLIAYGGDPIKLRPL